MDFFFYDLETRWSRKEAHSVSKQHPLEYFTDPRTEIQTLAGAFNKGEPLFIVGENNIRDFYESNDWSNTMMVAHNGNGFDHPLIARRFGVKPLMWADTLCMARPIYGKSAGGSLNALAIELKLGKKGSLEATGTEGLYVKEWTEDQIELVKRYNLIDLDLLRKLFLYLLPLTPVAEMRLIDLTCRMLAEPRFECDVPMLQNALMKVQAEQAAAIHSLARMLGVDDPEQMKQALMSNPLFADLLTRLGVPVPRKISITTGQETFALAKTDPELQALLDHDNPLVAAAVQGRLGAKSTILESRIKTFLSMAQNSDGRMPIALNYAGATTTYRWSGAFSANQQNLPRVPRDKDGNIIDTPTNPLRLCMRAPKGHKVVVVDLSGIELRVNHYLWAVESSMQLYADDPEADLYKAFAAYLYDITPDQVTKPQRQFAKLCQLGLGYGMSAAKFRVTAAQQGIEMTAEEADQAVGAWREMYGSIVDGWNKCGKAIASMNAGVELPIDPWQHCTTGKHLITTPSHTLRYTDLAKEKDEKTGRMNWYYGKGRHKKYLYGAKLDENIVQHLARNILAEQMLTISEHYPIVHSVHDEIVTIVPSREAKDCLQFMLDTMTTSPAWWPEIVLFAEGSYADTYGECK